MSSDEESQEEVKTKRRKVVRNEFIDDEAELSGDDVVSEDEQENSDDDQLDPELVDKDASDLDSDQEEEVRGLYHKQLESEDKRTVLLMQEQLEEKHVSIGQRRRRKFRWQTKDLIDNSLRRHYDPDDDDSQGGDDDDDDDDDILEDVAPKLRRPTAESILIGSTKIMTRNLVRDDLPQDLPSLSSSTIRPIAGPSFLNDDSNSNSMSRMSARYTGAATSDLNRFIYRDREVVEALAVTRESVISTRDEKDRMIEKELKRFQTSKSIFDQIYS